MVEKKNAAAYVNIVKLDAVMKGTNQALKWELHNIEVMTGPASVITDDKRVKTKGTAVMLVKHHLGIQEE